MGEDIPDKTVNQLTLNNLPRSYDSTIQMLIHLNTTMMFEQLSTTLLVELHRREHQNQHLGDDEALVATFHRQVSIPQYGNF
jgi:hypothetical protein